MRRPGLWVTNGHPGDPSLMLSWRPGAITCFYDFLGVNGIFDYKAQNPEVPIIVRFQHPRNWHQDPEAHARQLGEMVASKWPDLKRLDPYVYFANEMNLHYENGDDNPHNQHLYTTPDFYKRYAQWVRRTAEVIKNIVPEMKLVTPPFAAGHHEDGAPDDDGNPKDGWAGFDYLYETIRDYFDNIITYHAYWGDASGSKREWLYDPELSSWYAFRWRRVLKLFETRYKMKVRLIIDEAGNFGASDPDFTDQVIYYSEQCLRDARVIALTFFLWLDPTNSPGNVPNSWVQRVRNLNDHLTRLKNLPDIPITEGLDTLPQPPTGEPAPTPPTGAQKQVIRVLFDDGKVRTVAMEEYLRAVVPAEIPALWPAEALKAQAVAARTYARYAVENPRHADRGADICTDPNHCQAFDLNRIHANTDQAIRDTENIILRYNGRTINAMFSANCGGHTRNNEDVFGGQAAPYLRGVPCPAPGEQNGHGVGLCQHGARTLAQQGRTYDQILRYYFTGVTLGPPTDILTSSIYGTVTDAAGQPLPNVRVVLTGRGQTVEMQTRRDGSYRFISVPAGTYRLELPDYHLRKDNLTPIPGQDLVMNLSLPAPIVVDIVRGSGLPLIVGDWGKPDVPVLVTPPRGGQFKVYTGTKLEFGPGGFETYAGDPGVYILEIEGHRFEIPMAGQFTRLTFRRGAATTPPTGTVPPEKPKVLTPAEAQARLLSRPMPRSQAEALLQRLQSDPATRDRFQIQPVD